MRLIRHGCHRALENRSIGGSKALLGGASRKETVMKAIVLSDYGGVDRLEMRDVPEPRPAAGEIKVRVAASSVNALDWKIRRGDLKGWMPVQLPYILGRDTSGEVVEVGLQVSGFKVGDRVLGFVEHAYAEYVVAPTGAWALV